MLTGEEAGMVQDPQMCGDGRGHPGDDVFLQRPATAPDGILPGWGPHHDFGHEVVVVLADLATGAQPPVDAHPRAARFAVVDDLPWGGEEVARRVLGVDPELDGVAAGLHAVETEWLTGSHP